MASLDAFTTTQKIILPYITSFYGFLSRTYTIGRANSGKVAGTERKVDGALRIGLIGASTIALVHLSLLISMLHGPD